MKKITILFAFIALAAFAMAQNQIALTIDEAAQKQVVIEETNLITKQAILNAKARANSLREKGTYFSCTFEEEPAIWTIDNTPDDDEGPMCTWNVTDQAGAPTSWEPEPGSYYFQYLGDVSITGNDIGGKWAWIDPITPFLPGGDGNLAGDGEAWLQFDNINLTGVSDPMLYWIQFIRAFNPGLHATFVDISIDGGTTWTEIEVNADVEHAEYGDLEYTLPLGMAANESNVSIRFRWWMDRWSAQQNDFFPAGFGWQLDDIMIVDNPEFSVEIVDYRMSFFDYEDYTLPGQADYYHLTGHYGMVPAEIFESPYGLCFFNVVVENKGTATINPVVNIQIFDPNDDIIYDETIIGPALATAELDTIDFVEDYFQMASVIEGLHYVIYTVTIDGEDEVELFYNEGLATFWVTDGVYSFATENVTGSIGPSMWVGGGQDGDQIGVNFYYFHDADIESASVYIHQHSDPTTMYILHLLEYDGDEWTAFASTPLQFVEEEDIGEWVTVEFPGGGQIDLFGEEYAIIKLAMEFYYQPDLDLRIGQDNTNKQSFWAAQWNFTEGSNAGQWFSISNWTGRGLSLRVNERDPFTVDVKPEIVNNISVYPNPTTGILNIDNVKGANVEIFNIMGQAVESIYNANEFNTVDISNYANGTYIVRVIDGNNVNTFKINLVD